jgi:hypothetical protein
MSTDRNPKTDKELWQSLAAGPVASTAVSDLDFAAWLEGRLSETASARIEAAVAANPEMRVAAMDLADILGKSLPAAPARMAVRAQALVGFEVERQAPRRNWFVAVFESFALPRAAMATAAAMIAVTGFVMGGGLGDSYAQERYVTKQGYVTAQASNELTSFFSSDGI